MSQFHMIKREGIENDWSLGSYPDVEQGLLMRYSLLISLTDSSEYNVTTSAIALRIGNRFGLSKVEGL